MYTLCHITYGRYCFAVITNLAERQMYVHVFGQRLTFAMQKIYLDRNKFNIDGSLGSSFSVIKYYLVCSTVQWRGSIVSVVE